MKQYKEHYEQLHLSARRLRANPTRPEDDLWQALRDRKLGGLKFCRQKVIGRFIADFYCASARLVIEVDGDIHDYQKDVDAVRTRQFEDYGYAVIRFRNERVVDDIESVLDQIKACALERIATLTPILQHNCAASSPKAGRGDLIHSPDFSPDSGSGVAPLPLESGEGAGG